MKSQSLKNSDFSFLYMKIITNECKNTNDYRVKTPVIIEKHKQRVNIEPIKHVKSPIHFSF